MPKVREFWERVVSIAQELGCPLPLSINEDIEWSYLYYMGLKEAEIKLEEGSEEFKSLMDKFQELTRRKALYSKFMMKTDTLSLIDGVSTWPDDDDIRSELKNWESSLKDKDDYGSFQTEIYRIRGGT